MSHPHYEPLRLHVQGNEATVEIPADFVVTNVAVYEAADNTQTVVLNVDYRPVAKPKQLLNIPVGNADVSSPVVGSYVQDPSLNAPTQEVHDGSSPAS